MSGSRGKSDGLGGDASLGTEPDGVAATRPTPTRQTRPGRLRSRTSTFSSTFTPPLPPLMSRENSAEDLHLSTNTMLLSPPAESPSMLFPENEAGPSKPRSLGFRQSPSRPPVTLANNRTTSYSASLAPKSPISPVAEGSQSNKRIGLKRRISTPLVQLPAQEAPGSDDTPTPLPSSRPEVQSRARATSTSLVNPSSALSIASPTIPVPTSPIRPTTSLNTVRPGTISLPNPGFSFTAPSPDEPLPSPPPRSVLERVYDTTEASLRRLVSIVRPQDRTQYEAYARYRRGSDEEADSEKGMTGDEEESRPSVEVESEPTTASSSRTSLSAQPPRGGYWGIWASEEKAQAGDEDGYFSLPPTPPEDSNPLDTRSSEFELALLEANGKIASLPTPALSAHSLSRRRGSPERVSRMRGRVGDGWLRGVLSGWVGGGERGKTGAVLRELGWTLGVLVLGFVLSLGMALWLLKSLPITTLRHLPKSSTDLQLLSAEIKTYMNSSDAGWWHTVGVLLFVGCWKHAWSVPGAIVMNILVGSLLSPLPALALLTIITATGSLASYSLSRPLAPLIAVLFPKPLSLVRAALAPDSAPPPSLNPSAPTASDTVTPITPSSVPAPSGSSVWRRLLIMRAMGIVPWSGMNVACGVVGVDWRIFWLTTAAGSASWSYTTASIGDLLARLAIPASASSGSVDPAEMEGESLTGMLRDPVLLAKLALLTGLTLIPVFLKRSSARSEIVAPVSSARGVMSEKGAMEVEVESPLSPTSPSSALAQSLARFTPTPAAFDILSFGRTIARTGVGMAGNGVRHVGAVLGRVGGR